MGHYLSAILLPITKYTLLKERNISNLRELFGFNEWLNSPKNIESFNKYPGLKEEFEKNFEKLFENKDTINIENFSYLDINSKSKFHIREHLYLQPFYEVEFEHISSAYEIVYMLIIEPRLAKRLPTIINGVKIVPGTLHSATVITLETLQKTDLNAFRNSIDLPEADDSLGGREPILDEIMSGIKEAKKRECDFFTYVG